MKCPRCLKATRVYDSRPNGDYVVVRYRECKACGHRFKTLEREA